MMFQVIYRSCACESTHCEKSRCGAGETTLCETCRYGGAKTERCETCRCGGAEKLFVVESLFTVLNTVTNSMLHAPGARC